MLCVLFEVKCIKKNSESVTHTYMGHRRWWRVYNFDPFIPTFSVGICVPQPSLPHSCRRWVPWRCVHPPVIGPFTFFHSRCDYRPAEGRLEAKHRQLGLPPATTNRLLAEPSGSPWVNCAWVKLSRGRFVFGRFVKAPWGRQTFCVAILHCHVVHKHAKIIMMPHVESPWQDGFNNTSFIFLCLSWVEWLSFEK